MKENKWRLDQLLVMKSFAESRAKAQALIMSGAVEVNGRVADKSGMFVREDVDIKLIKRMQYVSRGGEKLAGALKDFNILVEGRVALDIGASTGGFTDCLLHNKARKIYAVDVGHGLLDPKIRQDKRVVVIEGFNARYLDKKIITEKIDLVTIDVSFISLKKILPVLDRIDFTGIVIALIKPQFEVGRKHLKKGVVRDQKIINSTIEDIKIFSESLGYKVIDIKRSVLRGPRGNTEYFILLERLRYN